MACENEIPNIIMIWKNSLAAIICSRRLIITAKFLLAVPANAAKIKAHTAENGRMMNSYKLRLIVPILHAAADRESVDNLCSEN